MVDIKRIKIRNFLSYGDYDTVVNFKNLGTTLLIGGVESKDGSDDNSNGAGKSNLVNAILWCLFGRTMHKHNPGDKVVNWHVGENCCVQLEFSDGSKLIRTRKMKGHNDLLYIDSGGNDVSLGTTKIQQANLNKMLGLDWDIFCGSLFFTQYGQSWMEMSDAKRKQALEREFHLDKIMIYADVAKERMKSIEDSQAKQKAGIANKETLLENYHAEVNSLLKSSEQFEAQKRSRLENAERTLGQLEESRDSISEIDVGGLQKMWDEIELANKKIAEKKSAHREILSRQRIIESKKQEIDIEIRHLEKTVVEWENKGGSICSCCEQSVPESHVNQKTSEPKQKLATKKDELSTVNMELKKIVAEAENVGDAISKMVDLVESKKPSTTILEAKRINAELCRRRESVDRQLKQIENIKNETNDYAKSVDQFSDKIKAIEEELKAIDADVRKMDKLYKHVKYVYKVYNDRNKIKSYILGEYVPYLNERIKYYLGRFGLDLNVEFTNGLSVKSDMWGYEFCSGGERKRIDVAIMLSILDLHTVMYGKQCNILVFDEVERSLDTSGVNVLIDIIKDEVSSKADAVLVITHNNRLKGMFESEITIVRENRFSRISEISN